MNLYGKHKEDVLLHLYNYVHSNLFEPSSHIQSVVCECFENLRTTVGPGEMMLFVF